MAFVIKTAKNRKSLKIPAYAQKTLHEVEEQ